MDIIYIVVASFFGSWLTFYSGFGLGTLLLPIFALFTSIEVAISMTAIVHLANNVLKLSLFKNHIKRDLFFRFGIPAVLGAMLGAVLLTQLTHSLPLLEYEAFQRTLSVTPLRLTIGILIIVFAILELSPFDLKAVQSKFYWSLGGYLSGFFGGLSGHQGALRSLFLSQLNLSKEVFIGTGVACACLVDIARMGFYINSFSTQALGDHAPMLALGIFSAFIGTLFGKKYLTQISHGKFRWVVGLTLILFGALMSAGVI